MDNDCFKKRFLTVTELAEYLRISERTIYNQICPKAKKTFPIPVKRVGRLVRFDRHDVDAYIENL